MFALFSNATFAEVALDLHNDTPKSKSDTTPRVETTFNSDDIHSSADIAARSCHSLLVQKELIHPKKKVAVFDFKGGVFRERATGRSAGLAFALKFAQRIIEENGGKKMHFSVAATGEISDVEDAYIVEVDLINDKFRAVSKHLKAGDVLFYPKRNEELSDDKKIEPIDPEERKKLEDDGILLYPVSTLAEAIDILWPEPPPEPSRWPVVLISLLILVGAYAVCKYWICIPGPCNENTRALLHYGQFQKAKTTINDCLNTSTPDDSTKKELTTLKTQLSTVLEPETKLEHLGDGSASLPLLGLGDGYRFRFLPDQDCYFYLFQFDNDIELLFPPTSDFLMNEHHVIAQELYELPDGENYFMVGDSTHHGQVTLIFLASFWPAKDIEEAYQNYEIAPESQKKLKRQDVLNRILIRKKALESGIKGIFYKKKPFLQE